MDGLAQSVIGQLFVLDAGYFDMRLTGINAVQWGAGDAPDPLGSAW
jgi:hypothetical protein